jgi:hypothetical protein
MVGRIQSAGAQAIPQNFITGLYASGEHYRPNRHGRAVQENSCLQLLWLQDKAGAAELGVHLWEGGFRSSGAGIMSIRQK